MNEFENLTGVETSGLEKHMAKTFSWMFAGVFITFLVAAFLNFSGLVYNLLTLPVLLAIIIAQFGLVIALSARVMKISYQAAIGLFLVYSVVMGFSLSTIALVYEAETIIMAFMVAAIYFGSLAVIGYTTKVDLSKIGSVCFVGLILLVIFGLFSLFFNLEAYTTIYCVIGLIVFTGLTAWDTQKAKKLYKENATDIQRANALSIYSALELYLDFINIFLYILRLMNKK